MGAFLSGGVDSSAVVALMLESLDVPLATFSVGFEEPSYDERRFASTVARHLGTDHHEVVCTATFYCWLFDQIVLLPALIEIAALVSAIGSRKSSRLIVVYAALNLAIAIAVAVKLTGAAYAWTSPAWLLAYLFAKWQVTPALRTETAAAAAGGAHVGT